MQVRLSESKKVARPQIFFKAVLDVRAMNGELRHFVFSGPHYEVVNLVVKAQDVHRVFYKKFHRFGGRKRVTAKDMYGVLCGAAIVHYKIVLFLLDTQTTNESVVDVRKRSIDACGSRRNAVTLFQKQENARIRSELGQV